MGGNQISCNSISTRQEQKLSYQKKDENELLSILNGH